MFGAFVAPSSLIVWVRGLYPFQRRPSAVTINPKTIGPMTPASAEIVTRRDCREGFTMVAM